MKFDDLTGRRFGRLTVDARAEDHIKPSGIRESKYLCRCDCGKEIEVVRKNLISGHTTSCGRFCTEKSKERQKVEPNKKVLTDCFYATRIECFDMTKCKTCGWNPKNTELRNERIKNLKKRMCENEQSHTEDAYSELLR